MIIREDAIYGRQSVDRKEMCIRDREYAKDINLDLYAYEWEAGKAYGVVIVDFGPKKIAEKIYGTTFQ